MLLIAYVSFLLLLAICLGLEFSACRARPGPATNPAFRQFQLHFYRVYFLALWADWLQGPYLYKLYHHYNFLESQIAIIYVCGFASSVLFGLVAGWLVDRIGRRQACILFCATYIVCCLTKLSQDYFILILGRVLGGLSTSLLATAFEAWYVHQHVETHDFPKEWIPETFSQAASWNHGLAVAAGFVATFFAEWLSLGPVAPFLVAVPFLMLCGGLALRDWEENWHPGGVAQTKFTRSCVEGLQCLLADSRVLLLGGIQALFESVIYIFVFLWTPVLDPHGPPLGIIFSCFMASCMIGASLYRVATSKKYLLQPIHLLSLAVLLAFFALFMLSFSTSPGQEAPSESFLAFLVIELACGLYFPSMGFLRDRIIPKKQRAAVLAWFRLPLHLLACMGMLALYGSGDGLSGTRHMFVACAGLMLAALLAVVSLFSVIRHDTELRLDGQEGLQQNGPVPSGL
ncbi:molybdate-anion transporter [Polypterus senegalus]|nr:molybdate-anion transporter [Polypterus senegalus]XP_039602656.1 molybdate-anion transporter [Polypterus senegalus]